MPNTGTFKKILNGALLLFFLIGYLEWGQTEHTFIFNAELDVFSKMVSDPMSVMHPLIIAPFAGQVLLLLTLFQDTPGRMMTLIGLACLGSLIVVLFLIGAMSLNIKMIASTLPFIVTGILVLRAHRRYKVQAGL